MNPAEIAAARRAHQQRVIDEQRRQLREHAQTWHSRYAAATAPISQRQPTPEQRQAILALRPVAQAEDWPAWRYCNAVRSVMGLEPWSPEFCEALDQADSQAARRTDVHQQPAPFASQP